MDAMIVADDRAQYIVYGELEVAVVHAENCTVVEEGVDHMADFGEKIEESEGHYW